MRKSKSLRAAHEKIDAEKLYTPAEAIKLMLGCSTVKFDPTAEIHFNLGIDPKHADQQVRSTVSLPHGTGKKVRVIVFCEDDKVKEAKAAGAIEAGAESLIEKINKGWMDFDKVVAQPSLMKDIAKVAKVLGPKGLMPNPKSGTVTDDIEKVIKALCAGQLELRNEKHPIVHSVFGKLSFGEKKLTENLEAMLQAIKDAKPSGVKNTFIEGITINSTMGAGIKVEL